MNLQFHNKNFEYQIREKLNIYECPITDEDAKNISELDLDALTFNEEDFRTLTHFTNLVRLNIEMCNLTPGLWTAFPKMRELGIICTHGKMNFESFSGMTELEELYVSGGDYSWVPYENLDALLGLKKLQHLWLTDFGETDIRQISQITQLKSLSIGYAENLKNIDSLGEMVFLEQLQLIGLKVDNLDFLDKLPDGLDVELGGILVRDGVDVEKWKRFSAREIWEISAGEHDWNYIDLSALE